MLTVSSPHSSYVPHDALRPLEAPCIINTGRDELLLNGGQDDRELACLRHSRRAKKASKRGMRIGIKPFPWEAGWRRTVA